MELFVISFKDFLTKKFILLCALPLLFSLIILGAVMVFSQDKIYEIFVFLTNSGGFDLFDEAKFPILALILNFSLTKFIINLLFYTFGVFFVIILSVFITVIITSFLTPTIAREINKRHYNIDGFVEISTKRAIKLFYVVILRFFGILLVTLPFLFVPIINLFAIQIPFFYLYYSLIFLDVAPNTLRKNRFELLLLDMGGYKFKAVCLLFYTLCLVPFVAFVGQIYFIIYFSHFFLRLEKQPHLT